MIGERLLAAQRARFTAADPVVPVPPGTPDGELLTAATASGERVAGVLQTRTYAPGTLDLLWSAQRVWQLFPYPGESGTEGMDALLRAWRHRMDAESPGPDSACTVTWPSRDAPAIRAFLQHGMVPISVLAIRTGPPPAQPPPGDVTVRLARPEDFEEVRALTKETFDYTELVTSRGRPEAVELMTPQLRRNLAAGAPVWLAETGGVATAIADCGWIESAPGTWAAELLPPGRWGYVNNVATTPGARGNGIGQALMAAVHRDFAGHRATGSYLYYNPTNPLSSVFWPRQGYRPLWTFWEVQPASALR
ncbi:GNAT family N-acetyltransferase [Amycolatopsis acidiphila]|uniref:GNAT family N-acetyltransferase n=1 Tax=Amycolatopsis acidiphila TaxID=715473 RepID=A0A558AKL5_9PSEU|nr:GNAT family N-acetyltransferase [Amycolatopsis acidiphila]TVT24818.1 GNAT family N-acetyltransferase [Amycolatopsis acidiphila]UIJ62799.1 GNAT family N-acetyltransferase [Amycolatopsis acidiphila]GHG64266.1 GNAT family N-acetyltransferase [Amycolatopsis acidiphila]